MSGRADDTTHAAAVARLGAASRHEAEILAHLDEIINGEAFKGSPRSQSFLRYVVETSLHGDPADLRERCIGVALFGRAPDYDTAEDAIVRVTASDVRKRLLQHYGKEGAQAKVRIGLPPGSYVPEFTFQTPPHVGSPAASHMAQGPGPSPAQDEIRLPVHPKRKLQFAVAVSLVAVAVLAVSWKWVPWARSLGAARSESLIEAAFRNAPSLQVVVADDTLVLIQVLLGRRFSLEEYENLSYLRQPELVQQKELQRFWASLSTRQLTNIGDLQNASRLVEMLRARKWDVSVRHARQMHARTFRSGNYIILGSSVSNPWAALFPVRGANFPFGELPPPGLPEVILNRQPLPGEPPQFVVHRDPETGRKITYARVVLTDNLTQTGRVLLVEGQSMSATEMAGQFLLRDGAAAPIRRLLSLPSSGPLPNLEMVLKVAEQNEIGEQVDLAAVRRIARQPTVP